MLRGVVFCLFFFFWVFYTCEGLFPTIYFWYYFWCLNELHFDVSTGLDSVLFHFRLKRVDCSHLQQELYQALHGSPRPEHIAIFGNADPAQKGEWTRILSRNYSVSVRKEIHILTKAYFPPLFIKIKTRPVSIVGLVVTEER